jgi:hypothetical protein
VAEALAAALFAGWLALTFVVGLEGTRGARAVRRADVLGLVPGWSFFAPNPGTVDYHLLARTRSRDGSTGPFREIAPPASPLRRGIWNPEKRVGKAIFDCGQELVLLPPEELDTAEYTLSYLALLSLATSRMDCTGAASIQFLLLQSAPSLREPELLVRSQFHPVAY